MTRVRPAAKFSRATAVVVSMAIAINPVDKSLIVVIELVLSAAWKISSPYLAEILTVPARKPARTTNHTPGILSGCR
jgi:hypothetical protein